MNVLRLLPAVALVALVTGCQPLSPGSSDPLSQSDAAAGRMAPRDDDTFSGRLASSTQQVTETVSKPFDPTYWQQRQQQKQIEKQQKQQQDTLAKRRKAQQPRSRFMNWMFPEPKRPRTLSEWLSQERPGS